MRDAEHVLNAAPSNVRTFGMSWPLLVAFLALLVVVSGGVPSTVGLEDPDTYWHIATGRWIFEHVAVPQTDPFSHSMFGAVWTAHEWLSELVLAGVYQVAGWTGLVVVVALAFAGTLAYVMRFLLARMESVHALLFTVFTAPMLAPHLLARPHVLVWPVLAVWIGALVNAGERGRSPPWWLLPLMMLWANLHGSFILGLALVAALALDAVLICPLGQRRASARRWLGFIGLSVAAAMATPSGWQGLWHSVQLMRMTVALDAINEWRSPDFHKLQILELWLMLLLAIACLGRMRLPWLRLLLVLGFVHLALRHQRHVEILGLVSPFLIASPLALSWRATKGPGRDAELLDRVFHALAAPARAGAVAATALLAAVLIGVVQNSGQSTPRVTNTPEKAVQAAVHAGAVGPVLNSFNFGGYLIYSGIPVFIDGRADMYGDAFVKRYLDALQLRGTQDLPQLISDYHIGWTLLEPGTPAVALLDHLPGWRRVYADAVAVVHVRVGGAAH